jgi:hypothetical protein
MWGDRDVSLYLCSTSNVNYDFRWQTKNSEKRQTEQKPRRLKPRRAYTTPHAMIQDFYTVRFNPSICGLRLMFNQE